MLIAKPSIWLLDNDEGLGLGCRQLLESHFVVTAFTTIAGFREAFGSLGKSEAKPDVLIADLTLSDGTFLDILREQELALTAMLPVVIISANSDPAMIHACFGYGIADYLTRPINASELLVKVERLAQPLTVFAAANFTIDYRRGLLRASNSASVTLTRLEVQIFDLLKEAQSAGLSRKHIQEKIWGNLRISAKAIDVHLYNLRAKLAPFGARIELRASKYRLVLEGAIPQDEPGSD